MADLTGMMQAAAGGAGGGGAYIEDVFSTYLYTGNGSTQTITNGIDLDGEGGLVWIKRRSGSNASHTLFDTATYTTGQYYLATNLTNAFLDTGVPGMFAVTSSGFSVGNSAQWNGTSSDSYASWAFRTAPKFFDIVTYTGDGTSSRVISHNLDSAPGCIIIKRTDSASDWFVFHRSATQNLRLDSTTAGVGGLFYIASSASTTFTLGTNTQSNDSGGTYVAYLFAHDAGGFGDDGEQNVVTCGSYVGSGGSDQDVSLGFEPQMMIVKCSSEAKSDGWIMVDTMRGMDNSANSWLFANTSAAENEESPRIIPTATGFRLRSGAVSVNDSGQTFIYIAIRRGPMKTPEAGTEVFKPVAYTGDGSTRAYSVGFPVDLSINMNRDESGDVPAWNDRLRGSRDLYSSSTSAETTSSEAARVQFDNQTNIIVPSFRITNAIKYIDWVFRRAPGFFDVVCWTGDDVAGRNVNHNLGVTPELIWVKRRNSPANHWYTYHTGMTGGVDALHSTARLNLTEAGFDTQTWKNYSFTSTTFSIDNGAATNASGGTYIAYLFATLAGISKVGSYTGTGTTLQINCGFSAGARFVMIRRTDSTGDWYVWDSARGIIAGNDPYLLLNSTAVENTSTDYIDPLASGFEISSSAPAAINASGGSFIFLAIA
jgi:hypothetical protein